MGNSERFRIPERFAEEFNVLIQDFFEWTDDFLGLSSLGKFGSIGRLTLFDQKAAEEFRTIHKTHLGWRGGFSFPANTITLDSSGESMLGYLMHEMTHLIVKKVILVRRVKEGPVTMRLFPRIDGFENSKTQKFQAFSEAVTELINIAILWHASEKKHSDVIKKYAIGYAPLVLFVDMLIAETARRVGTPAIVLEKDLYRGYLLSDQTILKLFEKAFGRGTSKILANLSDAGSSGYFAKLAEKLGLDQDVEEYRRKLFRYEGGEVVHLSSGRTIQIPFQFRKNQKETVDL